MCQYNIGIIIGHEVIARVVHCTCTYTKKGPGSSVVNYSFIYLSILSYTKWPWKFSGQLCKWAGDSVNGPGGSVFNYGFINALVI